MENLIFLTCNMELSTVGIFYLGIFDSSSWAI